MQATCRPEKPATQQAEARSQPPGRRQVAEFRGIRGSSFWAWMRGLEYTHGAEEEGARYPPGHWKESCLAFSR